MDLNSFKWSGWFPLAGGLEVYKQIPNKKAGLYRIRATQLNELVYIGQTGRCLRERLRALRAGVYAEIMPYNDPHTAAPNLWVWKQESNFEYEFSFLPTDISTPQRQGLEDYFLWRHRQEKGCSTLCNYGRFHRSWIKPTNKKQGRSGHKLEINQYNPAGLSSNDPLRPFSSSSKSDWMELAWSTPEILERSKLNAIPKHAGIYRILDTKSKEVIYIGETKNLASRIRTHEKANWGQNPVSFSFVDNLILNEAHLRHEIEIDLIGAFFEEHKRVPLFQYGASKYD